MKIKVLISISGFFPAKNFGGPAISINNLTKTLSKKYEFFIVTGNTDLNSTKVLNGITSGWNERNNCKVKYLDRNSLTYQKFEEIVEEIAPDIIYINSFFGVKFSEPLLKVAVKLGLPILLAPRGEMCDNALNIKKLKKLLYIQYFNLRKFGTYKKLFFHSTSSEETQNINKYILGSKLERIFYLPNIPDFPIMDVNEFRQLDRKVEETYIPKIIFVSRIHKKKNLLFALNLLAKTKQKYIFDIYGPIEDEPYWEECKKQIDEINDFHDINYCGVLNREQLFPTLLKYDIFLFPTLSENYGHVIAEALSSGCKLLISDNTPWQNLESEGVGWAIPLDRENKYINILNNKCFLENRFKDKIKSRIFFEKEADLATLQKKYEKLFEGMLKFND